MQRATGVDQAVIKQHVLVNWGLPDRKVVLGSVLALTVGATFAWYVTRGTDRRLRAGLLEHASIAAQTVDVGTAAALTGSQDDLPSPSYRQIKAQLSQIRAASVRYRFVYLMGQRPDGTIVFLADSAPAGSEDESPPGQTYGEATELLRQVFADGAANTEGPETDRWGTWISAFVPLPANSSSFPKVVLGVDVDASEWQAQIVRQCALSVGVVFLLLLLTVFALLTNRAVRRQQQTLRDSEERYRSFVSHSSEGIYRVDIVPPARTDLPTSEIVQWINDHALVAEVNQALAEMYGLKPADMIGRQATDFAPHYGERAELVLRAKDYQVTGQETLDIDKDGADLWLMESYHGEVVDGRLLRVWGVQRDVTASKRSEQALQESEARYRSLVEHSAEAIFVFDVDAGHFVEVNENAVRLLGLPKDQLLRMQPADLSPPRQPDGRDSLEAERSYSQRALNGEAPVFEWTFWDRKDNREIPCEVRLVRLPPSERQLLRGSTVDISGRRQAEEEKTLLETQLRQAQKMEAIGQLAGGVAHDFNNLLQVINGYTDMALDDLEAEHPIRELLAEVAKAGKRAAILVGQLLAFSRRQVMRPEGLEMNDVVAGLIKMLRRVIGEHIQLDFVPGYHLGMVYADRGMIEQVFMNLAVNARDAMPGGGRLTIETQNTLLDDEYCTTRTWARPGRYVMLSVTDNGCGMDNETLGRIFEPFYTTKGVGRGTGLGLATVYGIVKQHDGMITAHSEPGKGTTFKVFLPVSEQHVTMVETKVETQVVGGQETLLLAEDDQAVAEVTRAMLENAGYTVLSASNGREAVAVFEKHADRIDLLILDAVMPEMGGREAYEQIKARRPDVPALFASGYNESVIHSDFVLEQNLTLIPKPFGRKSLLSTVRQILDGQNRPAAAPSLDLTNRQPADPVCTLPDQEPFPEEPRPRSTRRLHCRAEKSESPASR